MRSSVTAERENAAPGEQRMMEEVVERENMRAAYQQVRRNGGAPGIDGMSVEELGRYLAVEWSSGARSTAPVCFGFPVAGVAALGVSRKRRHPTLLLRIRYGGGSRLLPCKELACLHSPHRYPTLPA